LQCCFGGTDVRVRFPDRIRAFVELAACDRALVPEALRTLVFAFRVRQARLRGGDLRLRTIDLGSVGGRIDREQEIAAVDQRALDEVHRLDGAGDSCADFDTLDRLQAPGELVPRRDVGFDDGRDGHRDRRWLRGGCSRGRRRFGAGRDDVERSHAKAGKYDDGGGRPEAPPGGPESDTHALNSRQRKNM
jgi:hypothetical protein